MAAHPHDLELCRKLAEDSADAFAVLLDRYFDRVFAFVHRRVPRRDLADRLAEEALTRLFASIGSYSGRISLDQWVLGVVKLTLDEAGGEGGLRKASGSTVGDVAAAKG